MKREYTPLNGTKTHPLKPASVAALDALTGGPKPAQDFNPGVVNRLMRTGLVEFVNIGLMRRGKSRPVVHLRRIAP